MQLQLLVLLVLGTVFVCAEVRTVAERATIYARPCGAVIGSVESGSTVNTLGTRSVRCADLEDARTWKLIEHGQKNGWIPETAIANEQEARYSGYGSSGSGSSGSYGSSGSSGSYSSGSGSGSYSSGGGSGSYSSGSYSSGGSSGSYSSGSGSGSYSSGGNSGSYSSGGNSGSYTSGGDGYTSGGDGYTSGGDGYTSGGDGYTSGGDGQSSGGDGQSSGGDGQSSGGDGQSSGGDGQSSGGDGQSSGGKSSGGKSSGGQSSGGQSSGGQSGTASSGGKSSGGKSSGSPSSGGQSSGAPSSGGQSSGGQSSGGQSSGGQSSGSPTSGGQSSGGQSSGGQTTSGGSTSGSHSGTGYAVDVSDAVSQSQWSCLKQAGYSLGIVRAYRSTGSPDPNAPNSIQAAQAAGLSTDVYMFPCPKCSASAASQVQSAVSALKSSGATFNTFWFDIEGPQYWSSSSSTNTQWLSSAVSAAKALGLNIGVYTSASQWQPIMGSSSAFSSYPLWYAHYDNSASFSDFSSFGGWTSPVMKQYVGDATRCSVGVDENYFNFGN